MNYIAIFDTSNQSYAWFSLSPGAFFAILGVLIIIFAPSLSRIVTSVIFKSVTIMRLFGLIVMAFSLIWIFISYNSMVSLHDFYRKSIDTNKCVAIEGRVELFSSALRDSSGFESFYVNGVYFAYADSINPGTFNTTNLHGGPMKEGLPVRICYIHTAVGPALTANKILRLEVSK